MHYPSCDRRDDISVANIDTRCWSGCNSSNSAAKEYVAERSCDLGWFVDRSGGSNAHGTFKGLDPFKFVLLGGSAGGGRVTALGFVMMVYHGCFVCGV
jgi:hypothetical protein